MVPAALAEGAETIAGASLGHLAAWLEARKLRRESLIVNDWKTLIANHMGPPEDFDAFVMSFLRKGPKKWDVLFLDRGERGVTERDLKKPTATFANDAWDDKYVVYKNRAAGVAGASFYVVSASFLEKLPALLREFEFTAWTGGSPCCAGTGARTASRTCGETGSSGWRPNIWRGTTPGRALSAHHGAPVPGGGGDQKRSGRSRGWGDAEREEGV